jgi:hypothetical protein
MPQTWPRKCAGRPEKLPKEALESILANMEKLKDSKKAFWSIRPLQDAV